ncbi:polyketide antibiotic transporter [Agromyces mediolanus]|uniref:ABC transporter permease n=1 Tax=Agromyces mediolanus TaxID=41986 RepID=UPI003836B381
MSALGALLGQRLRRDRWQLVLWVGGTALLAVAAIGGVQQSYGTEADRQEVLAAVAANPVIMLFRGLPSGAELDAFTLFLILPFLAMMAAFMSSFLAVRHTRMDEELGRAELVAATPAGRAAPLAATVLHGLLANVVLAALVTASFAGAGYTPLGSLVSGLASAGVGLVFLGVGLVAAQLMRTSRGANSLGVWVLLVSFLVCGLGNALGTPSTDLQRIESSGLTWLSPFGWAENSRPFADDAWWPLALCAVVAIALTALAVVLQRARDLDGSFIAERAGRLDAPATLGSPIGLVWRLSRGSVVGWAIGGLLTGVLATSLGSVIDQIGTKIPAVEQLFAALSKNGSLEQGMVVIFFTIVGVLAACAAVQTVTRARQEETHGTAEQVLAAPVDRVRWLASFLAIALVAAVAVCAAAVLGAWLGAQAKGADASLAWDALVAGTGQLAAAAVFLVLTALVFVLAPRLTIALGWVLVLVALLLGMFGPLFQLPDWVTNLSPVAVTPIATTDGVDVKGLWWLLAIVVAGGALALGLMRRRELAAGD